MVEVENKEDKIQQICDVLRKETLEPAKQQAKEIVENAEIKAKDIVKTAEKKAKDIINKAENEAKNKEKLGLTSLKIASQKAIDELKKDIEKKFFKENLKELIEKTVVAEKFLSEMILKIINVFEKEGLDSDLIVSVAPSSVKKLNDILAKNILKKLKDQKVFLRKDLKGGFLVTSLDREITLDVSLDALTELISSYIREDFRKMIFNM